MPGVAPSTRRRFVWWCVFTEELTGLHELLQPLHFFENLNLRQRFVARYRPYLLAFGSSFQFARERAPQASAKETRVPAEALVLEKTDIGRDGRVP